VRRIALLALAVPMVAAGCGGGSKETTTQVVTNDGHPASKADFVELADAICRNHQSRREDLESQARELGPLTSKAQARQVADLLRKESANRRAEISELVDLDPPPADAGEVNGILELLRTEADVIDTWAAAYDDLDAEAIREQQIRLGVTARRAAERARTFGFEVCGQQ
jgi:hypothetical protein